MRALRCGDSVRLCLSNPSNTTAKAATWLAGTFLLLGGAMSGAVAQTTTLDHPPSYQELQQLLQKAQPAPNPAPPAVPFTGPSVPQPSIEYNPATGQTITRPHSPAGLPGLPNGQELTVDPGSPGGGVPGPMGGGPPAFQFQPQILDNTAATKPGPITEVLSFPWQSVFKMLMRFRVGTTDYYWVCSASARGSFHLLTAGHCIHNWDPNNDGNTSDHKWADEIWVWAAQTDRVNPFGSGFLDFPYGVAKVTYMRSYVGWTTSQDLNYDYGLVTLDRRQGDHTGWMGAESSVGNSLNFDGYPAEAPYVSADEYRQYPGYDANNVTSSTANRINLSAYIYGGHSGGPAWRYADPDRWVEGINSTSDRVGSAGETRVTSSMITDITNSRNEDETARPPIARPNLIEYLWPTNAKDLLTNVVNQGSAISVEYNIFNAGFAPASNVTVDFYLSTNTTISTADYYIGTRSLGTLNAFTYINTTTSLTVPISVPPGNYYVGWIAHTTTTEYETDDNAVVIGNETVHVNLKPWSAHDFNSDLKSDVLWHQSGGGVGIWLMNGFSPLASVGIGTVDPSWQIAGTTSLVQSTGDFNGDGKADILWRHSGGDVAVWLMNGATPISSVDIGNVPNAWQIAGVGDFDGDGKSDILWRHSGGDVAVWLMNGTAAKATLDIGNVPLAWQIVGVTDFDGDGKADILWRHSGGDVAIWEMNGLAPKLTVDLGNLTTAWKIVGANDFNGDGKGDILWRHTNGDLGIWFMNGTVVITGAGVGNVDNAWQTVSTGDYDGDGKDDILWRHSSGGIGMWLMNGAAVKNSAGIGTVDTSWTIVE